MSHVEREALLLEQSSDILPKCPIDTLHSNHHLCKLITIDLKQLASQQCRNAQAAGVPPIPQRRSSFTISSAYRKVLISGNY